MKRLLTFMQNGQVCECFTVLVPLGCSQALSLESQRLRHKGPWGELQVVGGYRPYRPCTPGLILPCLSARCSWGPSREVCQVWEQVEGRQMWPKEASPQSTLCLRNQTLSGVGAGYFGKFGKVFFFKPASSD